MNATQQLETICQKFLAQAREIEKTDPGQSREIRESVAQVKNHWAQLEGILIVAFGLTLSDPVITHDTNRKD